MNTFFPVGFIIPTADSRNPSTYLGGTWVAIQDRTIVGVGTHALDWTDGTESATHKHSSGTLHALLTDSSNNIDILGSDYITTSGRWTANYRFGVNSVVTTSLQHSWGVLVKGDTSNNTTATNNLQPSVAKYLWQRTA